MALTHVSEVEVARVVHGLNMKTCRDINAPPPLDRSVIDSPKDLASCTWLPS
ncbi:hypothetical protein J6590_067084 [Homalodisca vitripennis]|nr:hypothetical protein J6590_067084 [Homalodisca vitripennis]